MRAGKLLKLADKVQRMATSGEERTLSHEVVMAALWEIEIPVRRAVFTRLRLPLFLNSQSSP